MNLYNVFKLNTNYRCERFVEDSLAQVHHLLLSQTLDRQLSASVGTVGWPLRVPDFRIEIVFQRACPYQVPSQSVARLAEVSAVEGDGSRLQRQTNRSYSHRNKYQSHHKESIDEIYTSFSLGESKRVKDIELVTNHEVKAVEYYIKEKLEAMGVLADAK